MSDETSTGVWTPQSLARKLHEAYGRVTPKFYGYGEGNVKAWDDVPDESKRFMEAVCAEVLGVQSDVPEPEREAVPTREQFHTARATAHVERELEREDVLSDWQADLRRQVDEAASSAVRVLRREG